MSDTPTIRPVQWASLRDALPNEASDFTPWLADNLDLLADALGLEELELVRTESLVETYRVDILARGTDGSGEEIELVIENQYGKSDHDHLGKLITYAAQSHSEAERVLGVWLVEQPTPAHIAALDFLNRISPETVGWVLISPKLIPSPDGYYIHFDAHAEPNTFLREAPSVTERSVSPERVEFMHALHERINEPLRQMGYRNVYAHPRGTMIRAYLPSHLPASDWVEVRVLASKERLRAVLFVRGDRVPAEENTRILAAIRERHAASLEAALADPSELHWHARGPNDRSDYLRYTWEGHGYTNTDPDDAAERVLSFARTCLTALSEDGREEFPDPAELQGDSGRADAATIIDIAAQVGAGEWTTYGDLATVASGSHHAAIIVGRIAASNPDFPNPHRVLRSDGAIPPDWSSGDGGGPEVCRQRLEVEGVRFLPDGTADPSQRLGVEELRERWATSREEDDGTEGG